MCIKRVSISPVLLIFRLESNPLGSFIQNYANQITTLQIENDGNFRIVDLPVPLIDCCTNPTTLNYEPS